MIKNRSIIIRILCLTTFHIFNHIPRQNVKNLVILNFRLPSKGEQSLSYPILQPIADKSRLSISWIIHHRLKCLLDHKTRWNKMAHAYQVQITGGRRNPWPRLLKYSTNRGVFCHVTHEVAHSEVVSSVWWPCLFSAIGNRYSNKTKTFHRLYGTKF